MEIRKSSTTHIFKCLSNKHNIECRYEQILNNVSVLEIFNEQHYFIHPLMENTFITYCHYNLSIIRYNILYSEDTCFLDAFRDIKYN